MNAHENELANFDFDLEHALGERDGEVPSFTDEPLGVLPLTVLERDLLVEAVERLSGEVDGEDQDILDSLRRRLALMAD